MIPIYYVCPNCGKESLRTDKKIKEEICVCGTIFYPYPNENATPVPALTENNETHIKIIRGIIKIYIQKYKDGKQQGECCILEDTKIENIFLPNGIDLIDYYSND